MKDDPYIDDDGMHCPQCNCADLRAYYTRRETKRVRRVRICRHCGTRVQTFETIDRELPSHIQKDDRSNTGTNQQQLPFE